MEYSLALFFYIARFDPCPVLNRVCAASQRMGLLIDDMLSLSRLGAGMS